VNGESPEALTEMVAPWPCSRLSVGDWPVIAGGTQAVPTVTVISAVSAVPQAFVTRAQ
jgi:hypothetical protein